jgi:hypothetical protein
MGIDEQRVYVVKKSFAKSGRGEWDGGAQAQGAVWPALKQMERLI